MRFEQLVLSGGGTRCFWQAGFLHRVRDEISLEPRRITCVSGGAMIAAGFAARLGPELLRLTRIQFRHSRNFHWPSSHLGFMPHEEAYRRVVDKVFDEEAVAKIASGPPIEVVLTELPARYPNAVGATVSLITYLIERAVKDATDKSWTRKLGMREIRADLAQAARDGRLAELITTAARIPPVFQFECWDNLPVIDGGSMSDAPMPSEENGPTLCLLASYFSHLPHKEDRIFIMPSETIPTGKIDLTESKEVQEAWDLGEKDGEGFLKLWRAGDLDWTRPHKIGDPTWRGRRWRPETEPAMA
ncbi:patatin-like phospholipase family protein [Parvularcula sp. ZS-1/3]|uniref:Patatin-like phospholipase family protein n=1 Tax=Parvularcula mediterranea TaxID=2732508 RepID=A0A7Y3RJI5_9PROT|nr:patatin-like phospholipase family protein [Parvularcula mediterranea]NNU15242.1 patatin-like phospholipase family protein [Parvularcula mediterranea]